MIYLDNPATSIKKPKIVYEAVCRNTMLYSVNAGRGGHYAAVKGAEGIAYAQDSLSALFNIQNPERLAFTYNATYALNMAISGILTRADHAVITSMEHNSVLRPIHRLCSYTIAEADKNGVISAADIERAIRPNTKLVVCTHASNVCGTIMPVREIGEVCKRRHIPFLVDAAQTAGIISIDVEDMNIAMLAFSGHKGLMGPLGTGGLYVREDIALKPLIVGGTGTESMNKNQPSAMPDMLHSGTANTPGIMALGTAAEFIRRTGIENISEKEKSLAEYLYGGLKNIDGVSVYGLHGGNRNGTVAFNIDMLESQTAAEVLNREYNIAVRGGYHCAYIAHKTLGTEKSGALRAGFGLYSTRREADALLSAVNKMAKTGLQ